MRSATDSVTARSRSTFVSLASRFRTPALGLLVAIGYGAGSQVGFWLTPANSPIATFWPPNAILLASFLLTSSRIWWVLVLAVLPAHLLIQLKAGIPVVPALGWFVGNTGEALLGAACIRFFKNEKPLFASVQGVVSFLVFGVLLATLVTSFVDAGNAFLTGLGRNFWTLWTTRLTSNVVSQLAVVPTIVTLVTTGISGFRKVKFARYLEASALAVGITLVAVWVFGGSNPSSTIPAVVYAPLPFLFWAAVRFGPGGLGASMLIVTLTSVWNSLQGRGPFGASLAENVISLHVLLAVLALPLVLVAALTAERRLRHETLRSAQGQLLSSQEQERHRLARELHDNIAQRLTLVGLRVDYLRGALHPSARPGLDELHKQVFGIQDATLNLSHGLYPFTIEHLGFSRALQKLCRDVAAESGIAITCSIENILPEPSSSASYCLFRVAQEALGNVVKDGHAKNAAVKLKAGTSRIDLRITDDGTGVTPERKHGVGLMRSREELLTLDGTLEIVSSSSKGTAIEASLPLKASSLKS